MTLLSRHISISIEASPMEIYRFAANPLNLPKWAAGLAKSEITKSEDSWIADSPMGQVKIKFAPENPFGVLDHDVTLPNGDVVHNPLRVLKNGTGAEVIFTLFRQPTMSDKQFEEDAKMVTKDLETLKKIFT